MAGPYVRELIQASGEGLAFGQDEPMLFPKHLPTYIRIQVPELFPEKAGQSGSAGVGLERSPKCAQIGKRSGKRQFLKQQQQYLTGPDLFYGRR